MKELIIDDVLVKMGGMLNDEHMRKLKESLRIVLNGYEVTKAETDLIPMECNGYGYAERFLTSLLCEGKSQKTVDAYRLYINKMLTYVNKNVENITDCDLIDYLERYKTVRNCTGKYMNCIRIALNSYFKWLIKRKIITTNPVDGVEKFAVKKVVKKPFTAEEFEKIRCGCKSNRDRAIVEFLYSTAVRVSELCSLNVNDVNSDTIIVLGKGNKEREVYLSEKAKYHLEKYLSERTDNNPALFVAERGKHQRVTKEAVEHLLKRIGVNAGVENVHPHRFRRNFATNALNSGIMPLEQVREILGHTNLNTTQHYLTVDKELAKFSHRKVMSI